MERTQKSMNLFQKASSSSSLWSDTYRFLSILTSARKSNIIFFWYKFSLVSESNSAQIEIMVFTSDFHCAINSFEIFNFRLEVQRSSWRILLKVKNNKQRGIQWSEV